MVSIRLLLTQVILFIKDFESTYTWKMQAEAEKVDWCEKVIGLQFIATLIEHF